MRIGIMGAMTEEVRGLIEAMGPEREVSEAGGRTYHRGVLFGREAVIAFSRWGKVAAATTATHLIVAHGVEEIVFTGVAGAADPSLRVGDVVVGSTLVQHDMDARPLYDRHEIPLLGMMAFSADANRMERALAAARGHLESLAGVAAEAGGSVSASGMAGARGTAPAGGKPSGRRPVATLGAIASGDRFFADRADLEELRSRLPDVVCVEMEGAAVAQVCHEYGVPLTVIRTISDAADEDAPMDFARFVEEVASKTAYGIIQRLLTTSP